MDKLVFVKEVRQQTKNEKSWLQVIDQDAVSWNVFLKDAVIEADKAYMFSYEIDKERGWYNLKKVTPVVNIFHQQAIREVTNKNDVVRHYSVAMAYSKDLVVGGKIPLENMFEWADRIFEKFQSKADEVVSGLAQSTEAKK